MVVSAASMSRDCSYNSSNHSVPVVSSQCVGSNNEVICECFNKLKRDSLSSYTLEIFLQIFASSFVGKETFFAQGERESNKFRIKST